MDFFGLTYLGFKIFGAALDWTFLHIKFLTPNIHEAKNPPPPPPTHSWAIHVLLNKHGVFLA